MVNKNTIVLWS